MGALGTYFWARESQKFQKVSMAERTVKFPICDDHEMLCVFTQVTYPGCMPEWVWQCPEGCDGDVIWVEMRCHESSER